jgi:hypothetical protein
VDARKGCAVQHLSAFEVTRTRVKLYANVWRDHGPENGNVFLAVHAKKHEDERLGLFARGYDPAKQEGHAAEESSAHF